MMYQMPNRSCKGQRFTTGTQTTVNILNGSLHITNSEWRQYMDEKVTRRLTMAQALIKYLQVQYVERDGMEQPFFAGCFGIFGHGIVGGIGQALQQMPEFR